MYLQFTGARGVDNGGVKTYTYMYKNIYVYKASGLIHICICISPDASVVNVHICANICSNICVLMFILTDYVQYIILCFINTIEK